jgi:hypothetical protein
VFLDRLGVLILVLDLRERGSLSITGPMAVIPHGVPAGLVLPMVVAPTHGDLDKGDTCLTHTARALIPALHIRTFRAVHDGDEGVLGSPPARIQLTDGVSLWTRSYVAAFQGSGYNAPAMTHT